MPEKSEFQIFLAHASEDKEQVRELYQRLQREGYCPWLDEENLLPGQLWQEEIPKAIKNSHIFIACLSEQSISKTGYVQKEFRQALTVCAERPHDDIYLIPLKFSDCKVPNLRLDEYGVAFQNYQWLDYYKPNGFNKLIQSIELQRDKMMPISSQVQKKVDIQSTLATATQKATALGLGILSTPFHCPFKYIGMSISDASEAVGEKPNKVGNVIVDSEQAHLLLEADGNFISYVHIELLKTAPWSQNRPFDSEAILGALSINPSELELVRKQTHFHTYYDHKRKLKIGVSCQYDDAPLSVGFSSKYYGM
jgi:TIR domain